MFILPGIFGLIIFIFSRPFEFIEALQGLPFLYIFFGLAVFGYFVDLRLGRTAFRTTPQMPWVLSFMLWCLFTVLIIAPATLQTAAVTFCILFALYFLIAHGVQSFRAFEGIAGVILACTLWISAVCVHEGSVPFACVGLPSDSESSVRGVSDGRPCVSDQQCRVDAPDPELTYRCERVGIFGITSIGSGRVRYVGVLQDPNEVSLAVGVGLPLAFGFYQRKKTKKRLLLLIASLALIAVCIYFTQSRGGQLVFLSVLGVYFIQRYKWKGALIAALVSAPMLLVASVGTARADAEASSLERLECWGNGIRMFQSSPIFGVGFGQFLEHHYLTAHNSFVLAPAEFGIVGMVIWSNLLYLSAKIPLYALTSLNDIPQADVARVWAMALFASIVGMSVGVFFLSFNYHYVLWVYLGIAGAFYSAVRSHVPEWKVPFSWKDLALVAFADVVVIVLLAVYTRMKGA
jgi:hypothetical protein